MTDEAEARAAEDTEQTCESEPQDFASALLPAGIEARVEVEGRSQALRSIRTVIGRGAGVGVQINDRKASRKHASIFFTGTEFRIRDEGSANGTLLNGAKVDGYVIRDGDQVQIGDTLLRFRARPPEE